MRKKLLYLLLSVSLITGVVGCTSKPERTIPNEVKTEEKSKKGSAIESFAEREEKTEGFGTPKDRYEDFTYLQHYEVEGYTREYVIYVPDAKDALEWSDDHQFMISSEKEGVTLLIMVIPDIKPGDASYERMILPIEDVIESYAQTVIDFLKALDDIKGYEMSDIDKHGEDKATMTVTHLRESEGQPSPFYQVIDIFREDDDLITISVQIDPELTTSRTKALLMEVEEYLDITIDYDEEDLRSKYEDGREEIPDDNGRESVDSAYPQTVSTGFWEFTLPEGWKKVPQSDPYSYEYSPTGRDNADTLVSIMDLGEGDLKFLLDGMDLEELEEELNTDTTDEEVNISDLRIIEDGNLGYALTYSLYTNLRGDTRYAKVYLIEDHNHMYMIMGMSDDDNPQGIEIADHIFETATKIK